MVAPFAQLTNGYFSIIIHIYEEYSMSRFNVLFAALLSLVLWGCQSEPTKPQGPTPQEKNVTSPPPGEDKTQSTPVAPSDQGFKGDPLDDPSGVLSKRIVYFGYDNSDVSDEYREMIQAHAGYLANHPQVSITLEGHCDERGTREYNLALGERRARAVRQLMIVQGVSPRQLRIISYGEEKPVSMGHDDQSWQQNRRVEIKYPGK